MPQFNVITRNPDEIFRETKLDIHKVPRVYSAKQQPMQAAREYVRAVNATKLERIFAKPFLGSLDGHRDGVKSLACHPKQLATLVTGSYDGEIRLWNLTERSCRHSAQAHRSFVRGIAFHTNGLRFASIGDDNCIKLWDSAGTLDEPLSSTLTEGSLLGIDFRWKSNQFATCGEELNLWEESRTRPLRSFSWGVDTINCVRFNPTETNLFASAASDRAIVLYDCRSPEPLRKVTLTMRSNALCWNPMESMIFTVANDDYQLYSFDMRRLTEPVMTHYDHVSAVIDLDYSPTGREFVSGSFDRTIRIFPTSTGRSREVYHTKRMQRVVAVRWTRDGRFLLSGSDEMNIRLWKANASEKLGHLRPREEAARRYDAKLKEKYATHPRIARIARHRHIPKAIYNAKKQLREQRYAQKRKQANRRTHSKAGAVPHVAEREKAVVREEE